MLRGRSSPTKKISLLLTSLVIALVSTGAVLRTFAMPVEARTTEAWFGYQSSVGFDYVANLKASKFYDGETVRPEGLVRLQLPVDPPVFHRVLITKFVESVDVAVPYKFQADRDVPMSARMTVTGQLSLPGVWEKPYALASAQEHKVTGRELSGTVTFSIPVADMVKDMETTRNEMGLAMEPLDLVMRPMLLVDVEGLREPVQVNNSAEYKVTLRSATTEIDEPRQLKLNKTLSETRVVPIVVTFSGLQIPVGTLRQVSLISLGVSLAGLGLLFWTRRKRPDPATMIEKLGSNLVKVRAFDPPPNTALADVRSVTELLKLQVQLERPVICAGNSYYLLDATTCYRLILNGAPDAPREAEADTDVAPVPAPLTAVVMPQEPVAAPPATAAERLIRADDFVLDPWITEVYVRTVDSLFDLQLTTGRAVIRTQQGYHLLDGTVCYTFRDPTDTENE